MNQCYGKVSHFASYERTISVCSSNPASKNTEYKSALYEDNDRGRREFLLDVCMFANSSGGILLIGVPERRERSEQCQKTTFRETTRAYLLPSPP